VDDWTVTTMPSWPRPVIALAVLVVTAAVLVGVALLASWPLARAQTAAGRSGRLS
jgi:hypothetical protein